MEDAVNNSSMGSNSQEESIFAGVVFHDLQEVYPPGKDIRCCYSIKPSVSTTASDWIGLYKVGWHFPKEYLCYEYSPVIDIKGNEQNASSLTSSLSTQNFVVFRGSKLPSEECEFYQFCYVTSSGEIRGASFPFEITFNKPGELECSEEEDDSGDTLLIVKNRTTILEDSLAKAYDEIASLKASKEKAEADCFKYKDMILNLEAKKNDVVSKMETQKKILDKAISEKTKFEEYWKESAEQLKSNQSALKIANEKVAEVQSQLENERLRNAQTSSEQQKFEEERTQLMEVITHKDGVIQNFLDTMEEHSGKNATLESEIQKLKGEIENHKEVYANMCTKMEATDDSLKKSKQAYAVLENSMAEQFEQVSQLQAENAMMKEELASTQKEMEELSHAFGEKQSAMEQKHEKEVLHYEKQIELFSSQLDGSQRESAAANEQLQEALTLVNKQQEVNQQQAQEYENSILKIQEQLNQERAFNNSLSSASDRQVAELQEQLNAQLQKNAAALEQTEAQNQEIKCLEECVILKTKEIEEMQAQVEEHAQQLESLVKQENESLQSRSHDNVKLNKSTTLGGSYFALQTAHSQLRKQYLQTKKDMENVWRQKADLKRQISTLQSEVPDSDLRFQMANLKKQIEDLRIRLNMGAEAYKAKFKECQKYEKQLKKAQRNSSGQSTSQSPSSVTEFEIQNLKQSLENEKTTAAALKKSLENYKNDAHAAKEELLKIKKKNDFLQHEVEKLDKEACISNEETQKRLLEDKELQSHIECLHSQLEAKCEALKDIEETSKITAEQQESEIIMLRNEKQRLEHALEEATEENEKVLVERDALLQEKENQTAIIEELKEIAGLVDSSQDNVFESAANDTSRGFPPSGPPSSIQNGYQCPMCHIFFPPNCAQRDFEQHVNLHFKE